MNVDEFFNDITANRDITASLRKAYEASITDGDNNVHTLPLLMYKTHVSTMVDGVEKMVSMADFKGIIDEITGEVDVHIPPINLPYGCFMFNKQGDHMYLNCYHEERLAEIKYDHREGAITKKEKYTIPMPNIITYFALKRAEKSLWQVAEAKYFVTPKTVTQLPDKSVINNVNSKEGIFRMPLSNVYGDHKLCYGGNTMPARMTDNLRGLDYYYQILTLSPFNSDLGINGVKGWTSPRSWYQHLATLQKFPYDLLVGNT